MKFSFSTLLVVFLFAFSNHAPAFEGVDLGTLYKVTTVRAAPGKLEALIDFYKDRKVAGYFGNIGEKDPIIMRHSQGDHWDLFVLQPLGSYRAYYAPERLDKANKKRAEISAFIAQLNDLTVFREELFAFGPDAKRVTGAFRDNSYFHLELFAALAGKHQGLLDQRIRENNYLEATGRQANLIFVGDLGSDIDVFTIGFYKSLQDFAVPSPASPEEANEAALANGFKSRNHIGFNLREFLAYHHDTLATKVE